METAILAGAVIHERSSMTDDTSGDGTVSARPPGPINLNRNEIEPAWLGFQTFIKLPVCLTPEDLRAGAIDVAICGVPWDGTAISRSGTHLGPRAIRACDYMPTP